MRRGKGMVRGMGRGREGGGKGNWKRRYTQFVTQDIIGLTRSLTSNLSLTRQRKGRGGDGVEEEERGMRRRGMRRRGREE